MRIITIYILSFIQLLFLSSCVDPTASKPIEISTPVSVSTTYLEEIPSFLIEIRQDHSVWYQILSDDSSGIVKVKEPIKETLKKAIANFKELYTKKQVRTTYRVKGNVNTKFELFNKVIDALKENEIYKYNLVTSDEEISQATRSEDSSGSLNLMEPKEDNNSEAKYANVDTKLTLLLLKNDLIYSYACKDIKNGNIYNYKNVRRVIKNESEKYSNKFVVLIKPQIGASYKNTVDILDEMTINKIKRYEMIKISDEEIEFIKKLSSITER